MLFFARTVITKENTMNKIWVDDIRRPPDDSWNWARTNDDARELLQRQPYDIASLDHDLGLHFHDPDMPDADMQVLGCDWPQDDGEQLAKWLHRNPQFTPKLIRIHSFNPVGARRMKRILDADPQVTTIIRPFDPRWRTHRDPDFEGL